MTVLPLGEVKSHLSELVGRVHDHHERVTVTVHGRPSAVLIAPEDLEALEETLAIMRDAATMNRLAESDAELARGEYVSADELAEAMRRTTSTVRCALSETLPEAVAVAAYEFITGPLLREPYRVGKRLLPPMDDRFSSRRGTYRIIYRIDDKNQIVTVVDIDHRRDVYRA
jgi:prevent-host-death family protein